MGSCSAETRVPVRGTRESRTGVKIHLGSKLVLCGRRLCGGREELEVGKKNSGVRATEGYIEERATCVFIRYL